MSLIWSHSRSQRFSRCPRQIFYEKQVFDSNNDSSETTIPGWKIIGDTVHKTIQGTLETARDEYGSNVDEMRISPKRAIDLSKEITESTLLTNRIHVSSEMNRQDVEHTINKTIKKHLHNWVQRFKPYYKGQEIIGIEVDEKWEHDDSPIRTIVDFVSSKNDTLYITDWKTNKSKLLGLNDRQMATYSLWAKERHPSFNNIECYHFYTKDGRVKKNKISPQFSTDLGQKILTESSHWKSNDIADFPTKPGKNSCDYCKWTSLCEDAEISCDF